MTYCNLGVLEVLDLEIHDQKYFSGSEIDIHSTGEDGVQAQVSVYSKIKIRAEDGFTKVSSLEAPSG